MADIGCLCVAGLFLLIGLGPIGVTDPMALVYILSVWLFSCVLMFWAKAYRDVMVARATGRSDDDAQGE